MHISEFLALDKVEAASGDFNQEVSGLSYDSRKALPGHVFFAIPGEKLDGQDFIGDAVQRGAIAVVLEGKGACPPGTVLIRVRDARRAMGLWGAHFFRRPSERLKLLGVTGTNGKTTITYLLESILRAAGFSTGVIGTINYRYQGKEFPSHHTTPESLDIQALLAEMHLADVDVVAMEVSSHALAQERVRGLEFDGALFTNLSRDHLDYHRDMDDYFAAKKKLFTDHLKNSSKSKKAAIINGGDPYGEELIKQLADSGVDVWSYGREGNWDIRPVNVQSDVNGLRGEMLAKNQKFNFSSALIGLANLENVLAAVGAGFALGLPPQAISSGIEQLASVPGRVEKVENNTGISILVDYAHTPDALEKVLGAVRPLTRQKVVAVFGCGGDRDRGKRPLMGEIAARLSDITVLTSDNPRSEDPLKIIDEIETGVQKTGLKRFSMSNRAAETEKSKIEKGYCVEADRREAIRTALRLARPGDLILIAGKGHEDYQILGPKRIHFDDREVAREEANRRPDV